MTDVAPDKAKRSHGVASHFGACFAFAICLAGIYFAAYFFLSEGRSSRIMFKSNGDAINLRYCAFRSQHAAKSFIPAAWIESFVTGDPVDIHSTSHADRWFKSLDAHDKYGP